MNITKGKISKAQKVVVYGPEGVGKSTFAAQFPGVVFIDTESSTDHMDVSRLPKPTSWTMLMQQVDYVKANTGLGISTLAIDTADWAERLCADHVCAKGGVKGIEDFGWGKGYTYLEEEFGRLLNKLQEVIDTGINVLMTAHAEIKKIEQPEEIGGYDHWQMKLEKKTMPLVKEWADLLVFANYKTTVINVDNQGAAKGKNKAQGNQRVMYTARTPWWDAKNRHDLADELPFSFDSIAHLFGAVKGVAVPVQEVKAPKQELTKEPVKEPEAVAAPAEPGADFILGIDGTIPVALADLMRSSEVSVGEIQMAVSSKGYYPKDTPIANYDKSFIDGVLVGAWEQVVKLIKNN